MLTTYSMSGSVSVDTQWVFNMSKTLYSRKKNLRENIENYEK